MHLRSRLFCAPSCLFVLTLLFLNGCGRSGTPTTGGGGTTYPAPALSAINPSATTAGSFGTTLTASGSNFVQGSEIELNGTAQPTLYVSSGSLQAPLTAQQLASAGTISVTVVNPQSAGGQTSGSIPLMVSASSSPNPVPTITSISPSSAAAGSAAVSISVSGSNFVASSTVDWNGVALSTNVVSNSSLTAQIPTSDLATAGVGSITVVNPTPGGGTSSAVSFSVNSVGTAGEITVNVLANSLAWDNVNQVIYLSLPSVAGANGNSVQILNPVTGALGASAFAGSEPDLLSVSSSSKYLYVSLDGASSVQRLKLPGLGTDISIALGSDSFYGSFYAMDLQADPAADGTVAVVRETPNVSPAEEGGVLIYDDGVARANVLCGWIESGCTSTNGPALYDSIQWNSAGTEMFAANNEDTGFDFYTIPVSASGFGHVTDYGGVAAGFGESIHFDATTGYVYDDNGSIINPANGTKVGTFAASGLMVPDGANGKAYFIGSQLGSSTYTIESFDINKFVPLATVTIKNVVGTPTHLIRWGTNGLAFTAQNNTYGSTETGAVYLISGSIVSDSVSKPQNPPSENVKRTWPSPAPLQRQAKPADELHILRQ